ncbi:arylamine N-acetyltransferase family protein [Heyndrickxia sporothermodurans]
MSNLNQLFRNRIGISKDEKITIENLNIVLENAAKSIPFENLCIIKNKTTKLTRENLIKKIINHEGGLCYDLNAILYLFLIDNGFQAKLIRGVIFDYQNKDWNTIGKTHVAIIITDNGVPYLIDTGFGGNLPLTPVPLTGEVVASFNGDFRVKKEKSEHGDSIFYMKLNHKDTDWKLGYAFDSTEVIQNISELNIVQKIIIEHPKSPFNKKPLITKLTNKGNITLTENTFTEWIDGKVIKKEICQDEFQEIIEKYFDMQASS